MGEVYASVCFFFFFLHANLSNTYTKEGNAIARMRSSCDTSDLLHCVAARENIPLLKFHLKKGSNFYSKLSKNIENEYTIGYEYKSKPGTARPLKS